MVKVAPSILSADFAFLARDVQMVENAGAEYLHIDVMDGHFVPNMSLGAQIVKCLRPHSKMIFDTHLMISDPLKYLDDFISAGSDIVTVHYEAAQAEECLKAIRAKGARAGLSIKPMTEPEEIRELLPLCDLVLIMSVEPGFGGQAFMPDSLRKARILKQMVKDAGLDIELEIDGGIGPSNIAEVAEAGIDVVVAGSSVYGAKDPHEAIDILKNAGK